MTHTLKKDKFYPWPKLDVENWLTINGNKKDGCQFIFYVFAATH